MAPPHDLKTIRRLEEELFKPAVRASISALSQLLADDFLEFGRSGHIYDKQHILSSLAAEPADGEQQRSASDFALKSLADNVVLLTYRSNRFDGGRVEHSLRSSIWKFADGRWQMVFHQGTPESKA